MSDEVGRGQYQSNAVSEWLARPGQPDGFQIIGKLLQPIAGNISALWKENRFTQFPDYKEGEKSPMIWTHAMNQWGMMRGDPEVKKWSDAHMDGRRDQLRLPWHEIYPAASELDVKGYQEPHEPPVLVDVGGNTGYDAADFKAKNPHIK
ncbi:MAG: hypothetical protein LQ340_004897, partial [Diploschistes diacapsis]